MAISFNPIKPLLQTGTNSASRWFSYVGLCIGVLLLLCSIQMFVNIQNLMNEGSIRKGDFDFISITKTVTNETMGQPDKNIFHQKDIDELKSKPFIADVSPLLPNDFRVKLSAGDYVPFSTDLFLESLDNEFIDTVPPSFNWKEGQPNLPIIISSNFYEIYNVFAPAQGLPQLSKETAMGLPVIVKCEGNGKEERFEARIVAFSDRVNSVLVPKTFLDWANKTFGTKTELESSRLFIKAKDVNDPALIRFFDEKKYKLNKDSTLLGRNKIVFQGIFSGLGVFGLLVVILALLLFSFYLQLVIARSRDSLQLLLTLGYSPAWLGKKVTRQFVPVYLYIVLIAIALTELMQWSFHKFVMFNRPELSSHINWMVVVTGVVLVALSIFTNFRMVNKLLRDLNNSLS